MIQKEHLSWIMSVPATDGNFKSHLEQTNQETIIAALKDQTIGKGKRQVLERKLRKLQKLGKCKDCGSQFSERERNKDLYTEKLLKTGLCTGCFRILESEQDPESTKYLDMNEYKKRRTQRIKENK